MPPLYKAPSRIRRVPNKWGITVNRKLSIMTRVGYKHFEKVFFKRYVDGDYCLLSEIYFAMQKVFVFKTLFISAYLRSWASWAEIYLRTKNLVLFLMFCSYLLMVKHGISVMHVCLLHTAENDVCVTKFWLASTELSEKGALATKIIIGNGL